MDKPKADKEPARKHIPRWEEKGGTYFATFNLREGIDHFTDAEKEIVFNVVMDGRVVLYDLFALVVMSNHVHLIIKPIVTAKDVTLSRAMQYVKGLSSFLVNKSRGRSGPLWETRSHTRLIRNESELYEEKKYIANNPVLPGIVRKLEDYKFLWYYNKDRKRF